MDVAAAVLLLLTVVAGVIVLGLWADPVRTKSDRRSVLLVSAHVTSALAAVTLWLVFAVGQRAVVGAVGLGVLLATVTLGISTLLSSRTREQPLPVAGRDAPTPVPAGALVVHGAASALAVVLAVVALVRR